ncbi:MAG: site-2 protease family protein [Solirubrobacterales bacterium]
MSDSRATSWPPDGPPEHEYEPIHPSSGRGSSWRARAKNLLGPIAAAAVLLVTKGKALLLLLPKVKIFTTSATMLVSIGAYALIWPWTFALGFVLLLLIHELGHVIQLRREGVEASAPMFIPFLGAVVAAKSMGDDAAAEARVGLAGPILGSIATLIPLGIWLATDNEFWQALAYIGFFINLINLLPVLPLDGGRAMAALSPWMWIVGFAALIALTFAFPNPIMILVLLFGGMETWRRWKARHSPESQAYHSIPGRTRALVAVTYLLLAGLLAFGVAETFLERDFSDV